MAGTLRRVTSYYVKVAQLLIFAGTGHVAVFKQ